MENSVKELPIETCSSAELLLSECTAWSLNASGIEGSIKVCGSAPQCTREDQTILSAVVLGDAGMWTVSSCELYTLPMSLFCLGGSTNFSQPLMQGELET